MIKQFALLLLLLCFFYPASPALAQAKIKASTPFAYTLDATEDVYNEQITNKTLALNANEFVVLHKQGISEYTVEKYSTNLKKAWSAAVPIAGVESVIAFLKTGDAALVITHRDNGQGSQQLHGHLINLATGATEKSLMLLEAPMSFRKANITASEDGARLLAYQYQTDPNQQITNIKGKLYDSKLTQLKDTDYNLNDLTTIFSADIQISSNGDQYVSLISDNMQRLTVRRYTLAGAEVKSLSVLAGGAEGGNKLYILDGKYKLLPNGKLFGTVLTADEKTAVYHSLRTLKFDFEAEDMLFAEEFKFTPAYLENMNNMGRARGVVAERLEDIYISELLLTADNRLVVIAEKKFAAGGENAPYFGLELHLFCYNDVLNLSWNSVVMKQQEAPATQGFSGISYRAHLAGNMLQLLTLEQLNGKHDLFMRSISTVTGSAKAPVALGIAVAKSADIPYIKSFTSWLADKEIVAVARTAKAPKSLQLLRLSLK
ncbi:hypothetical protein FVR03_15730 [Pontibacter qinzhouensis]|uniref:Uncharacterized protein n=1 Tax=Pontibacter qinzhouensis TaxID=2603253 RepID=A0A5C8JIS3_9BACT|nr:hypothetical protein [Pontibacter qinzhouensis]TXK37251.1 hypothetical protein FVR03_15730 [Pontibacter qinzhouensis]